MDKYFKICEIDGKVNWLPADDDDPYIKYTGDKYNHIYWLWSDTLG